VLQPSNKCAYVLPTHICVAEKLRLCFSTVITIVNMLRNNNSILRNGLAT